MKYVRTAKHKSEQGLTVGKSQYRILFGRRLRKPTPLNGKREQNILTCVQSTSFIVAQSERLSCYRNYAVTGEISIASHKVNTDKYLLSENFLFNTRKLKGLS